MSILEKYSAALKNKDEAAMNELLHDDFKFTMHKYDNGKIVSLETGATPMPK
jgi:ketosteroid isomerase-like protein